MPSLKLVWRNFMRRPLRSTLTILSLMIAIFVICSLRSLITTMRAPAEYASGRRLSVMSATGLFVEMPPKYQAEIDQLPGVAETTKFQWFGGYYRNQQNFFAQFAIDADTMFAIYPECAVPPEQLEAFRSNRTGCIIGSSLAKQFGWKLGDTIPIIGALHPHPEDKAWEFQLSGIYHSNRPNFDNRTLFFHWAYYEETLKQGGVPPNVVVFSILVEPEADVSTLIAAVEDAFHDSEQRVDCATEAEFQRQFQTMFGNIPLFLGWIGGGVVVAILVACLNTMLMSTREQTSDIGILKALGFTDGSIFGFFIAQSMVLCLVGGALGIGLAWATQGLFAGWLEFMFPGYVVTSGTFALAAVISILLGPIAGLVPALRAQHVRCVDAIRTAV